MIEYKNGHLYFDHYSLCVLVFFFKQKTAYEIRISDWSSDVCSSDLHAMGDDGRFQRHHGATGGGAFINEETRALILKDSLCIWLDADIPTLVEREIGRASCRERVCQYV